MPATGTDRSSRASARGKDAPSREASPGRDEELEYQEASGVAPPVPAEGGAKKKRGPAAKPTDAVPEGEEGEKISDAEALNFKIRQASSKLYKELGNRQATTAEIAEEIEESEETVTSARKALTNARKGARLSGARRSALKAGFGSRRSGASRAEVKGGDMEQSLITPSDIQRLATAMPLNMAKGSYSEEEIQMRMALIEEKLPVGSAREIIAFIEPLFRSIVTGCVERQSRLRTQRITASTMYAELKKYAELGVFTSIVPPEGLVRFGKEDGVDTVKRGDPESGYLMEASSDEKKKWRSADKKDNKTAQEALEAVLKTLEDKKDARKRKAAAEPAGEAAEEEEAPAPAATSSKKKGKRAVAA